MQSCAAHLALKASVHLQYDCGQKVAVHGHSRLGEVSCGRSLLLHIITTETITAGLCFPVTVPVTSTSLSTTFCLDMLLFFFLPILDATLNVLL